MVNVKKIRIGNDIKISWSIFTKSGEPYSLKDRKLSVSLNRVLGDISKQMVFDVVDNAISLYFYGKDQERTGIYTLTLVENDGLEDMHTVDSCDAFQLVARSCDVNGDACGCGNIEIETVELTSTLSADVIANLPSSGGIEVDSEMSDTSENPVQNKIVKRYIDEQCSIADVRYNNYWITEKQLIAENIAGEKNDPNTLVARDESGAIYADAIYDGNGNRLAFSSSSKEQLEIADGVLLTLSEASGNFVTLNHLIGGSKGQVLSKKSDEDFDTEWVDAPQGGGSSVDIVDNLTTADPTKALSANMGRTLNEKFQYKNYLAGKNLDQKGNILDAEGWNVTIPIAVVGGSALTFECGGTNTSALCEYDADGNFLDYWGQSIHPRTITTKANTAYVRLAVPNSPTQDYFVAQNDVVLFNKLRKFNIVEQVAENTQKLENIGDSVEVKVEDVTDANGKPLDEILSEISAGGAEGALVYNAPQTLTDEQKLQVAKNIGQTERLILEWSNEDAEVLQPVAYDAETGYFTVETMPSWLAEDGVSVNAVINYTDAILYGSASSKNVVIGSDAGKSTLWIKRINETQFLCHIGQTNMNAVTIPSTVDVSLFYFTNTVNPAFQLLKEGEISPTIGIRKFHIRIMDIAARESRYIQLWLNGNPPYAQGSDTYRKYPVAVIGHFSNKCFGTTADMEVWVDYGAEGGPRGKFVRIDSNGAYFDNQQNIAYYTNPTMHSEWGNMWGFNGLKQAYLRVTALGKRATVRITEIIE